MAAIAAVGGALTGAAGTIYGAVQEKEAADYNAKVARRQAAWEQMRSQALADRQAEQDRKLLASQRARVSASGLDPSEATPLQLLTETAARANVDYRNILLDGQMRSDNLRSQASAYRVQGRNALIGGVLQASSQLAGGASQYGRYQSNLDYQRQLMNAYTNGRGQQPPSTGGDWTGGLGVSWLRR